MKPSKSLIITIFTILFVLQPPHLFPDKTGINNSIILPSTYGWMENGEINIALHAWVFELNNKSILGKGFVGFMEEIFEDANNDEKQVLNERIRYFVADNKKNINIKVSISGEEFSLPSTQPDGHTFSIIKTRNRTKIDSVSDTVNFSTPPGTGGNVIITGTFRIIGEKGYSIISDIDDTIKESNVLNKKELLKNLFIRRPAAVNGMPELYRMLEKKGCSFHYVSGSPWQLYPSIYNFLKDEKFPGGSVDLKMFRVKDKSFVDFVSADQMTYKIKSIKTILDRFPGRRFVLIGDSSEQDPEIYTTIAGQYGSRIKYIFIRNVGRIDENSPRRKKITEKAGNTGLVIFKEATELESYITDL